MNRWNVLISLVFLCGVAACGTESAAPEVFVPDANCVRQCDGKVCGDDGCGGVCGTCADNQKCREGACVCALCGAECGECPELDWIDVPEGTFVQGCTADAMNVDKVCESNELPPHSVNVPAFGINRLEITVDQYNACVATGACLAAGTSVYGCNGAKTNMGDHPINCVKWGDAADYCMWAGGRLGSESEWEFAARGSDGRIYPWGNRGPSCSTAWTAVENCSYNMTHPVGQMPAGASPFGVEDMAGNVSEWVADPCHTDSYNGAPTDGSVWPADDDTSACRVLRGGGYNAGVEEARSRNRMFNSMNQVVPDVGIRCFR